MARAKTEPIVLVPRGLSRVQAAAYIGVSTTFFDTLVSDGRMPVPKKLNTRRIWDRWALDAAFDALADEDDRRLQDPEDAFREWELQHSAQDDMGAMYRDALGYDPRGMSKEELAAAEEGRQQRWRDWVLSRPLGKRERDALAGLYELRDRFVSHDEIKGAGPETVDRLVARGFATQRRDATRFYGWQITDEGKAAFESGISGTGLSL